MDASVAVWDDVGIVPACISELFVVDEVSEVPVKGLGTGTCRFDMRKETIDETMTV